MTTITKDFIEFTEKEMASQFLRFSKTPLEMEHAKQLAKEAVGRIDWNNSALMHKGLSWIAKNYLKNVNN